MKDLNIFPKDLPSIGQLISLFHRESAELQAIFIKIAGVIVGILFMIELIKEAMNLASGRGFNLDRKLAVLLLVCSAIVGNYAKFENSLYLSVHSAVQAPLADMQRAQNQVVDSIAFVNKIMNNMLGSGIAGFMAVGLRWINFLIIQLILLVLNCCIDLIIVSLFVGFILTLNAGPLFIVFLVLEETRNWFFVWLANIVSYLVKFIFVGFAVKIGARLVIASTGVIKDANVREIFNYSPKFWQAISGPALTIGIMLVALKVAGSLTGSGGGGSEMLGPFGAAYGGMAKIGTNVVKTGTRIATGGRL